MLVEILITQEYADFPGFGTNRKTAIFKAGDIVDFPDGYADVLLTCFPIPIAKLPPIAELEELSVVEKDITSAAASLALKKGVDVSQVDGTGTDGRITVGDVKAAIRE